MIIEPKVRNFICLTSHPEGCKANVKSQIDYVQSKPRLESSKKRVLVIGASTGFGLSSRITCAFANGASTLGVIFEKAPEATRTASAGWYNTAAFEQYAGLAGLYAKSINGDAFSDDVKNQTLDLIASDLGQVDLVIYSLASPRRTDPANGITYKSVLKPIGQNFFSKTIDIQTGKISDITIEKAEGNEIEDTVKVMGGDDWKLWIDALLKRNLLSKNALTVAYSYVGPTITEKMYRHGTIGQAKDHLEKTARTLTQDLASIDGKAYISVNKALVTQSSSAIPVIPLYIALLYKAMKEANTHEGCIEQIQRLFETKLTDSKAVLDDAGRIRMDDWELEARVQDVVLDRWKVVDTDNVTQISDIAGYKEEFLKLFGFGWPGVDYQKDTDPNVLIKSI